MSVAKRQGVNRKLSVLFHMYETNAAIETITANGFINPLLASAPILYRVKTPENGLNIEKMKSNRMFL